MAFQLRPFDGETDLPRITELINSVELEPIAAASPQQRLSHRPPGHFQRRAVAVDADGYVVGFSNISRNPWMIPERFWMRVIVDAAYRRRGIGTLLYDHVLRMACQLLASQLVSEVRDDCAECLSFAQQRGFGIERHISVSRLYLAHFDESRFAGTIEAAEAAGICFFPLADLGAALEAQQKLYELHCRCAVDEPNYEERGFPSFQMYRPLFGLTREEGNGQIVAADGDTWVGMILLEYEQRTNAMHNSFTAVDRAYRNRKLALALKLLAIRHAHKYGADYMYTNNDATNAPILALNRTLGYQPDAGIYMLRCTLEDAL